MTISELWHIKIGTRVQKKDFENNIIKGTVIKRKVENEVYGFSILHNRRTNETVTKDLLTGRKLLTVTIKFDNGDIRYYDTTGCQYGLKNLNIILN